MNSTIRLIGGLVIALLFPGLANAQVTACQLLNHEDIEQISGLKFEAAESQRLNVCAGLCESLDGWRCLYRLSEKGDPGLIFIEVHLPPFMSPANIEKFRSLYGYDSKMQFADINDLAAPALWSFNEAQEAGRGILNVESGDRVRFVVVTEGIENKQALSNAKKIAQLALSRFRSE